MKKTLIITLEYPPTIGGIATYVHQMASALDPEKTVVYAPTHSTSASRSGQDNLDSKKIDENVKYKVIRKKPYFPVFIWPRWLRLFFQIRKIVKQEKIEVILINHVLPVGYIGILIKKLFKIPYLIISHGTDVSNASKNFWKKKMLKNIIKSSEQVVFNSESLKRRFLRILPEFANKSLVLYPCPDKDFLIPPPKKEIDILRDKLALEGKKVILTISRMVDGKGFPHMVRVLPKILKKEPHVVWIIIGDGPKKEELMKDIQKRSLQNVVRYLGQISHKDIKKYYYLADLFVLLTHPDEGREEGLGLVFLEAAASGLAVVAGKSGGVEEAVLHTQTGIVIDIRQNALAMEDSIVELLDNKNYAKRLGDNAQERIKANFRWETQIKMLDKWLVHTDYR